MYYIISSSLSLSLLQDDVAQKRLIEKYMALPNELWDSIIQRATAVSCNVQQTLIVIAHFIIVGFVCLTTS